MVFGLERTGKLKSRSLAGEDGPNLSWRVLCKASGHMHERCKTLAADGRLELFKTTEKYDAAVGREQHHYPALNYLLIDMTADLVRSNPALPC